MLLQFWVWHIGLWRKAAFLADLPHRHRGFGQHEKVSGSLCTRRMARRSYRSGWATATVVDPHRSRLSINAPRNLMLSTLEPRSDIIYKQAYIIKLYSEPAGHGTPRPNPRLSPA